MRLLIQAGPGYRYSKFSTPVPPALPLASSSENEFLVRGSADLEYDISDSVSLTNIFI
jgi:putative salt-induced outer membrane protein YdiY